MQLSDLKRRHQEELDGLLHEAEQKLASGECGTCVHTEDVMLSV